MCLMQTSASAPDPVHPPLRLQSLASGSSGNAYLLESGNSLLLLDCGIGIRLIQAGLHAWGRDLSSISAVVLTHEHSDHVRALDAVQRRRLPVISTRGTANALGLSGANNRTLAYGEICEIGDVSLVPVRTSHDAAEPCGLLISAPGRTIGLFTDMGEITDEIPVLAETCDLLIFESNHDREMLRLGPYPQHLKSRVAGKFGHLSNDQAGGMLGELSAGTRGPAEIWLAHLSGTNNTPDIARVATANRIGSGVTAPNLVVLPRGRPGPVWNGSLNRTRQLSMLADF
jgi:phosphoribosyl 1,2-cyclic phosphodiesterase